MKPIIVVLTMLIFATMSPAHIDATTSTLENQHGGLFVLVSFPNLIDDVKPLLCGADSIKSIAPSGVDPHTYSLTPENIQDIERADIIISTAHASFEIKIREFKKRGLLHGVLVEIPNIPGITILDNPVTGQPDYHMPIYDPYNYIVFIRYLVHVFSSLNPTCKEIYIGNAEKTFDSINKLIVETPVLNKTAVADLPYAVYPVKWIGVKIEYLIVKEVGVQATPRDLERIKNDVSSGKIGLAVITYPVISSASQKLLSLAKEYGIPVLYVKSPISQGSIIDKLYFISEQIMSSKTTPNITGGSTEHSSTNTIKPVFEYLLNVFTPVIFGLTAYIIVRRRKL